MMPQQSTALSNARTALIEGRPDAVVRLWRELDLTTAPPPASYQWFLLLIEAGALQEARQLASRFEGTDLETRARSLLSEESPPEKPSHLADDEDDSDDEIDLAILRPEAPSSDQKVVELFLRLFGGRRDIFAQQWYDERRHRAGYRFVQEPLTERVAREHLDGRRTIGQYLLYPDASCDYGVIDLDLSSRAMEELRVTQGAKATPLENSALRNYALALIDAASRLGLPLWPEDSGGRGLHLWLFLAPRRPARAVRALLGQVLSSAGAQPAEVGVEIFPKQDRNGPKGLSSLVKLPLGMHQATLRRCALLGDTLQPLEDPLSALERLRPAPPEIVDDVLGRRVLPLPPLDSPSQLPSLPTDGSGRTLAEALRAIEPGRQEQEAGERMLEGCAVLRRILREAYDRRHLEPSLARALLYTIGLVGPANKLVEDVFAAAGASRKELDRARRGLPSPPGCKRLRRLGLASPPQCPCEAMTKAQPYATPTLFAVGNKPIAPPRSAPFASWLDVAPDGGADPLHAIAQKLELIENKLEKLTREK